MANLMPLASPNSASRLKQPAMASTHFSSGTESLGWPPSVRMTEVPRIFANPQMRFMRSTCSAISPSPSTTKSFPAASADACKPRACNLPSTFSASASGLVTPLPQTSLIATSTNEKPAPGQ
jgi:hypothetical protein